MNLRRERDPHSIKHYLQDLPNSENMEESYIRTITHIKNDSPGNRKLAGAVLRWLLCTVRPLSVNEMIDALQFLGLAERATDEFKKDILHVCHGLVQVEMHNNIEYFRFIHFSAHQSLYNYFEHQSNPSRRVSAGLYDLIPGMDRVGQKLDSSFSVNVHHEMAQTCMKYILNGGLATELLPADELYNCRQEFDLLATEKPFFLYASQAWMKHLNAGYSVDLAIICLELFRNTQNLQLSFQIFWFQKFGENFPRGSTPLHIASYFGLPDIISPLLEDISGPFITDNQSRTPIYWAAFHGDYASLKELGLIQGCDRQILGEALLAAVEGDQVKLIADLLTWGADPGAYVRGEKNALFYATLKGDSNLSVVQQLIEAGAKLEPEAPTAPPLQAAAMAGALEITHYLLSLNVDVNVRSHEPGLPLKTAVFAGQHDMAELLLNSGADIILAGEKELIELASLMGDPKMIDILLQHSPSHLKCEYTAEGEEVEGEEVEGEGAESEEGTLSYTLLQHKHKSSTSTLVEISDPESLNQSGGVSSSQIAGLRVVARQALRLAKMGNMGQEIINMVFSRVQRIVESNFEALDFGFIAAAESISVELGDEIMRAEPSTFFIETAIRCADRVLVYIAPKIQTREQMEYNERLVNIICGMATGIGNGSESNFREACINTEKSLLEIIKDKSQTQRADQLFAEVEIRVQSSVAMEDYPLVLRVSTKTYLTAIMAIIPPEEGIARFAKFLDGVVASGLSNKCSRPGNWRKMVAFIEVARCIYAYGYKRLYPQIQLKVALLRKAVKDNPKLNPDGIMMDKLAVIAGGRPDWQWDVDEAPWWHYRG